MPKLLLRIIELASSETTKPAVAVQLCQAIEKLQPLVAADSEEQGLDFAMYTKIAKRLLEEFPSESAWQDEKAVLERERDSALATSEPAWVGYYALEAENLRLRSAVGLMAGRSPDEVIKALGLDSILDSRSSEELTEQCIWAHGSEKVQAAYGNMLSMKAAIIHESKSSEPRAALSSEPTLARKHSSSSESQGAAAAQVHIPKPIQERMNPWPPERPPSENRY